MLSKTKELLALYEDDLEAVLKKEGIFEEFSKGHLFCVICHDVVTKENLGALLLLDKISLLCSKASCLKRALEVKRGKNK